MNEDLIVTQIGLIFSQVRYLRMAIDQVERSTARYAGVALDVAAAGPGRWGAPPLEGGALRVFVTNIGDLIASDNSFLGILSSGIRFVTSSIGGIIGGAISGFALPVVLAELAAITANVLEIMKLMGFNGSAPKKDEAGKPEQSGTMFALLERLRGTSDSITKMLGLANTEQASGKHTDTEESATWLRTMQAVSRIVDGLVLLLPNLIGAFAALLNRIDKLKGLILDLLEFAMRNLLILRGIILLTLYDTIAAAATLGGKLLGVLAEGVGNILAALFRMLEAALSGVLSAVGFLSGALTTMVNNLLPWLAQTVFTLLEGLGRLPVFRLIFAFVEILPTILPLLLETLGETVDPAERTKLNDAREHMIAGLASASTTNPPKLPDLPDFANLPGVQAAFADASSSVMGVANSMQREIPGMIRTTQGMMNQIAGTMRDAIGPNGENLNRGISKGIPAILDNANSLAESMRTAQNAVANQGGTRLDAIATKYEEWLTTGGLQTILGSITRYFQSSPAEQKGDAVLGSAVLGAQTMEPARPTVEISEVIVEITAVRGAPPPHKPAHPLHSSLDPDKEIDDDERYRRAGSMDFVVAGA